MSSYHFRQVKMYCTTTNMMFNWCYDLLSCQTCQSSGSRTLISHHQESAAALHDTVTVTKSSSLMDVLTVWGREPEASNSASITSAQVTYVFWSLSRLSGLSPHRSTFDCRLRQCYNLHCYNVVMYLMICGLLFQKKKKK